MAENVEAGRTVERYEMLFKTLKIIIPIKKNVQLTP